jgi:hypothetical protein
MIGALIGAGSADSPRERFEDALREIGQDAIFEEHAWYVTLSLRKVIQIPDERLGDLGIVFPENAFVLSDELTSYAKPFLDTAGTLVASVIDSRLLSTLVLDDRVFFVAPGQKPGGVPVFSGSATASATRGADSVAKLTQRLGILRAFALSGPTTDAWLARVSHWHTQSLLETDPWKKFLFSMFGLEILINKLFESLREPVLARLRLDGVPSGIDDLPLDELAWAEDRTPLKARFALVAVDLFPSSAATELDLFRAVNKARGSLAHGGVRSADQLPISAVQQLLEKFIGGALKRLVLGVSSDESWEELTPTGGD